MPSDLEPQRFEAVLVKSGSGAWLAVPFDPSQVWGHRSRYDVTGFVAGCKVRGPLVSDAGRFALRLGAAWLRDNAVAVGELVEVELAPEGPIGDRLPEDFRSELSARPDAKAFFESLPTFYRKNYLRWIESAKRPETRARRISDAVAALADGKRDR